MVLGFQRHDPLVEHIELCYS